MNAFAKNNLILFLILNFTISNAQIFENFENSDSVQCVEFSFPFYYRFEKDTILNEFVANKFIIGENSGKAENFWIGKRNDKLYSLKVDENNRLINSEPLNFESEKTFLYFGRNRKIKLKLKSNNKIKEPDYYLYDYQIINKNVFRKAFSKNYNFRYLMIEPKDDNQNIARKLAEILDNINYLHPFREGNGRAQREFLRLLALEKGFNAG